MPELPEVETTKRGIEPHILKQKIDKVFVRHHQLRWPIPQEISELPGLTVESVERRAKYLLLKTSQGTVIIHLGMSGYLRILEEFVEPVKHDHVDLVFANGKVLRYHDPRRFGAWLWTSEPIEQHKLFAKLAPEPLSDEFTGEYLKNQISKKATAIKTLLMNNQHVVGVGNIYANEVLFLTKIHPLTPAKNLTAKQFEQLVTEIKQVLQNSIKQGGTTLKDFLTPDGQPGYFAQKLFVYGRDNQNCMACETPLVREVIAQRASYFCPSCQVLK